MSWILVMYIYAGVFAKGDSVAVAPIEGFTSKSSCEIAGKAGLPLVEGTAKNFRYVCIPKN